MAKDISPVLKRCKALGLPPQTLGINKNSIRNPKKSRRKASEYSLQLQAKQKVKFAYGVMEKQFHNTYERAAKMPGKTGENLLQLLELRLDNVVYRLGLASTRAQARQLVNHGHFNVNGKRVNIPSVSLKSGDEIEVRENSRSCKNFAELPNSMVPAWLDSEEGQLKGRVVRAPERDDIDIDVEETLIVELYSK